MFVSFIVLMDILKYGFDIDAVKEDRDHLSQRRRKKRMKTRPIAIRFTYVHGND